MEYARLPDEKVQGVKRSSSKACPELNEPSMPWCCFVVGDSMYFQCSRNPLVAAERRPQPAGTGERSDNNRGQVRDGVSKYLLSFFQKLLLFLRSCLQCQHDMPSHKTANAQMPARKKAGGDRWMHKRGVDGGMWGCGIPFQILLILSFPILS